MGSKEKRQWNNKVAVVNTYAQISERPLSLYVRKEKSEVDEAAKSMEAVNFTYVFCIHISMLSVD